MNHFEKIEAYLEGWMSDTERAAFEQDLQTDAALKQDYEDWLQADRVLRKHLSASNKEEGIREIVTPLTQQYFKKDAASRAKVISFKKHLMVACAAAAILMLYFLIPPGIESYDVPPMPRAVVRGSENVANKGARLFNQKKYEEALPYLQQQANANPADATAGFYLSVCLIKTEQYEKALPILSALVNGPSVYKDNAAFFAALSAYKLDKKEEALKYAYQVPAGNHYFKKAQQIIKKLD